MKFISRPWFTVGFSLSYPVVFARDWALFLYYPQVQQFHWGNSADDIGPPMHWYGLVATSALIGLGLALVAKDDWIAPRVARWLWLAPCVAMAGSAVLLRPFFI